MNEINPTWLKAVIADKLTLPFSITNTFEVQILKKEVNILLSNGMDLSIFEKKKSKLEEIEKKIEGKIFVKIK